MHKNPLFGDVRPRDADSLADWLVALVSTLRADMHNDKLYPPGCVYVMVSKIKRLKLIRRKYMKCCRQSGSSLPPAWTIRLIALIKL